MEVEEKASSKSVSTFKSSKKLKKDKKEKGKKEKKEEKNEEKEFEIEHLKAQFNMLKDLTQDWFDEKAQLEEEIENLKIDQKIIND